MTLKELIEYLHQKDQGQESVIGLARPELWCFSDDVVKFNFDDSITFGEMADTARGLIGAKLSGSKHQKVEVHENMQCVLCPTMFQDGLILTDEFLDWLFSCPEPYYLLGT